MASARSSSSCSAYFAAARFAFPDLPRGGGFLVSRFSISEASARDFGFSFESTTLPTRTPRSSPSSPSRARSIPDATSAFVPAFAAPFERFFIARRSAAETRPFPGRGAGSVFFSDSSSSSSSSSRSPSASPTTASGATDSTDPSRNASSALEPEDFPPRRGSSTARRSGTPDAFCVALLTLSNAERTARSSACLATSSSLLTRNAYAYPMTSGEGGRYCFSPTCHTTPGARGSPFGAVLRTALAGTHQAEMTVRVSHAALRHRHAAPAYASESWGTRHEYSPSALVEALVSATSALLGALTIVAGAREISARTNASCGPMYFFTSASVWLASRAERTRQFSGVMNQWNFSNHSGVRTNETVPLPVFFDVAAFRFRASKSRFADSIAPPARATVFANFAACFFLRSKCSRAFAYAERDRSRVTATLFGDFDFFLPKVFGCVSSSSVRFSSSSSFSSCSTAVSVSSVSSSSSPSRRFTSPTVTASLARSSFRTKRATGFPARRSSSTIRSISSQL